MSAPVKEKEDPQEVSEEYSASVQFSAQFISGAGAEERTEPAGQPPDEPEQPTAAEDYIQPPEELIQQAEAAQEEMTRRDREILSALDEVLRRNTAEPEHRQHVKKRSFNLGRYIVKSTQKGAGMVTLALTLIFLGIVTLCVLVSGGGDYMLIARLSPAAAVFLGLELLLGWVLPGKRLRVNIPFTLITAAIVAGSCILAASLDRSYNEIREERIGRIAAEDIYEKSYSALRHAADIFTLTVNVQASPENDGSGALTQGDRVDIAVVFDGSYKNPREFAEECRRVMDAYDTMGIPVMNYRFSSETRLTSFSLDVEGLFQQDRSVTELEELVNYFYFEDFDYIQDMGDISAEASAEASAEVADEQIIQ